MSAQIHVSPTVSGAGTGADWANATTLESAVASATPGSVLWVREGTYMLSATLAVPQQVTLFGGFTGTETQLGQRNYAQNPTVLDAGLQFRVVNLGALAVLDGFTVQNGVANTPTQNRGGGVWMSAGSRINNSYILNNTALEYGGGVYVEANAEIFNTVIAGNRAKDGFAVAGDHDILLRSSTVTGNDVFDCSMFITEPGFDTICSGQTIMLTASTLGTSYLWSTGQTTAFITTPALSTSTTFTVTITTPDFCVVTDTFFVTVNPTPVVTVNVSPTSANPGAMVTFTATAVPPGGSFVWNDISATTGPILTAQMPNTGDLQFTVNYVLNGCSAIPVTETATNTHFVPPVIDGATLTADDPAICLGDSTQIRLTGAVRNSGRWVLYSGSCGGTFIDTLPLVDNPVVWVRPTATTTFFIRGEGGGQTPTACVEVTVTVNPLPLAITGNGTVCVGDNLILSNATAGGGTWSVDPTSDGAISFSSTAGSPVTVTGVSEGHTSVIFTNTYGCLTFFDLEVLGAPTPIAGDTNFCQGEVRTLISTPTGGTWSTIGGNSVEINPTTGQVTASTTLTGATTIQYQLPTSCRVSQVVIVHAQPQRPTASSDWVCVGDSIVLNQGNPLGGIWSISPSTVAGFNADTTRIIGLDAGAGTAGAVAVVRYQLNAHCFDTIHITVLPTVATLGYANELCQGEISTPTATPTGGTWSSTNTSVATVDPVSGQFTGVAPGTFSLIYTLANGCLRTSTAITVHPTPAAITGNSAVCAGLTTQLSSSPAGGTWSSSNSAIADVSAAGVVTGVAPGGPVTIRYTLSAGSCHRDFAITVNPAPSIALAAGSPGQPNQSVCLNAAIQNIIFTPVNATATAITWTPSTPAGITFDGGTHTISGTPTVSGTFTFTVSTANHATACNPATASGTITVFDAVLPGEIAGSQTVCSGALIAEFTSITPGSGGNPAGSSHQWQISTDNFVTFANIDGAIAPTYQSPVLTGAGTRYFRRMFNNACATDPVASNVVTVTVDALPPTPTTDTIIPNTACLGASNGIIVITYVAGMEYSINGTTFALSRTFSGLDAGTHTIFIRNIATQCRNSATVTVPSASGAPVPDGSIVVPGATICNPFAGANIIIAPEFTNLGTGPTFQWSTVDGSTATDIVGATSQDLNFTNAGLAIPTATTVYRLTATNTQTGCYVHFEQTITVVPQATISTQPVGDTICVDQQAVTLSVSAASASGHTYQWQSAGDDLSFSNITTATSSAFMVPNGAPSALWYRVLIMDPANVCAPLSSDTVRVNVLEFPTVASVTGDHRCSTGELNLSATADPATASIRWFSASAGGAVLSTTNSGDNWTTPSIATTTEFWAEAYITGLCESTARTSVTATVSPLHVITPSGGAANQSVCQGAAITAIRFAFTGGASGGTIAWTGPSGGTTAPSGISFASDSISGTVAGDATPGIYNWTITSTAAAGNICSPVQSSGSITVYLTPSAITGNSAVGVGLTTPLSSSPAGGTWSSLNPAVADVDADGLVTGVSSGTTTIRYMLSAGSCYRLFTITVDDCATLTPAPTSPGASGQSVCLNGTILNIQYVLTNATTTQISWAPSIPTGISFNTATHTISGSPSVSGIFTYTITSTDHASACSPATVTGTITVFDTVLPGSITSSLSTSFSICSGDTLVQFTSIASGSGGSPAGASHQWQISTDNFVTFSNLSGATSLDYQSPALGGTDTRYFRRVFNSGGGCGSAFSNVITVTVNALPPAPTTESITANTDCSGAAPNGAITIALVAGMNYSINGTDFGPGRTFSGLDAGPHTIFIRDGNNCISSAQVTVPSESGAPVWDTTIVTPGATICNPFAGTNIVIAPEFITSSLGASPTFQWNIVGGATLASTTQNLTLTGSDIPTTTTTYRLTATNMETNCHVHVYQTITVITPPSITTQPTGGTICVGQTAITLSVVAASAGHTYQWESSIDNIAFAPIVGQVASTFTVPNNVPSTLWYRVLILRDGGVCVPLSSDTVQVNVLALPTVASATGAERCSTGVLNLSATADPPTASIRWFSGSATGSPLTTGIPNTGITASGDNWTTPSIAATTTFWAEAYNGVCASTARTPVTAAVLPVHVINYSGGSATQNVCQGQEMDQIDFTFAGGATGGTIAWSGASTSAPSGITFASNSISGIVDGNVIPGTYIWTITSTPAGQTCPPVYRTGSIIVHQTPDAITGNSAVCVGLTTQLSSSPAGGTWSSLNSATASVNAAGLVTGVASGTTTIRYTLSAGSCQRDFEITVNPIPSISLASGSATQSVCLNAPITSIVYTITDATETTISWTPSMPTGITFDGSSHTISGIPSVSGTFNFTVSTVDHAPACSSATASGTITVFAAVSPGVIGSAQGATLNICSGDMPVEFTSTSSAGGGNPAGASYQWQSSTNNINFTNIAGATSPDFQQPVALTTTTYFRRNRINVCDTIASNVITVNVHSLPDAPTTESITANTACLGAASNGTITITYVAGMEYSIDGSTFGPGRTFTGLDAGTHTIFIRNIATECRNSATVTVPSASGAPVLDTIIVTPGDTICNPFTGTDIVIAPTFTGTSLGTSPTFQWSIVGGSTVGSTQNLTLSGSGIPTTATTYRLTATNTQTNCYVHVYQTITVITPPSITTQPVGGTICVNQTAIILSVVAASAGHTYQWESSIDNIAFAPIVGQVASTFTVPNGATSALWYRVRILRDGGVCAVVYSNSVQVNVLAFPTVASVTAGERCGAGTVEISAEANPNTASIRWFDASAGGTLLGTTNSGDNWTTPSITGTTTYWAQAYNGVCALVDRHAVTATVLPPHAITLSGGDTVQSVCQGQPIDLITFTPSGGATGLTIAWEGPLNGTVSPAGTGFGSNSIGGYSFAGNVTNTATPGIYRFTITSTPAGGTCLPVRLTGSITVNATPAAVTVAQDVRCGYTILTATGGTGGVIYWQGTTSSGTSTANPSTSDTVTAPDTYFFRARSAEGCWGTQGAATVTTIALPHTLSHVTTTGEPTQTVGQNSVITPIDFTFGGSATGTVITWTNATGVAITQPAGITVTNPNATTTRIAGSPSVIGVFNFSITTNSGGVCDPAVPITGTITVTLPMTGCNNATPGWGTGPLGAGFATSTTWTVPGTGGRPTQVWSDAVVATACNNRGTIAGGGTGNFNADCRHSNENANFSGHYFTWCAVMRFADQLCPPAQGWRVPTQQDFIDLDLNLGGTGLNSQSGTNIIGVRGYTGNANSPNGGVWGGSRFTGWAPNPTDAQSVYWSSTEQSATSAFVLHFHASNVHPQSWSNKSGGFAVRCVR